MPVTIGSGFDGMLDNIRIFGARRNITWIDEDGLSYVNTDVNNFTYGLLNLQELRALRAYDLRLPIGDLNGDRSVNATDIDLVLRNPGNSQYDIDGDLDTDRADADMLIRQILQSDYGDANLDHAIDTLDFNSLAANFGQTNRGWAQGDFTGDGIVDTTDFNLLASNFGKSFPTSASALAPEPTSIALTLAAFLPAALRLRRRARHCW